MARKRFNAEEKALLTAGTPVEWQNGAQWHPGIILGPMRTQDGGWQCAPLRNLASTRTIGPGDPYLATPGHVRARKIER